MFIFLLPIAKYTHIEIANVTVPGTPVVVKITAEVALPRLIANFKVELVVMAKIIRCAS